MLQCISWTNLGEPLDRPVAERTPARGQNDPPYAGLRVTFETLENRVVFAVDWQEFDVVLAGGGHDELPRQHEYFLRRQRDVFTRRDPGKGGLKSRGTYHRDQHEIHFRKRCQFSQAGEAAV